MLHRGEQTLPKTSTIPGDEKAHASLIVKVVAQAGPEDRPALAVRRRTARASCPQELLFDPDDQREELALRITSPQNPRFAQVMVNRLWQRYLGRGIVEPVDDWETAQPTHPELLDWLARELVAHDYDAQAHRPADPQLAGLSARADGRRGQGHGSSPRRCGGG